MDEEKTSRPSLHEIAREIDRQVPTLTYMGLAFWMTWNTIGFSGAFWLFDSENSSIAEDLTMVHLIASAVTLCLFAFFSGKTRTFIAKNWFTWLGAAVASLGTVIIVCLREDFLIAIFGEVSTIGPTAQALFRVGGVMTGFGTTCLFMRAAALYGALPPRKALSMLAGMYLVSACMFFVMKGVGNDFSVVMFILLPFVSAALFSLRREDVAGEKQVLQAKAKASPVFLAFLASVVLCSLTLEVMKNYILVGMPASDTIDIHSYGEFIVMLVMMLILLTVLLTKDQGRSFISLYSVATIIITLIIMISAALGISNMAISLFSIVGTDFYNLVIWGMLAYIIYQSQAEAIKVFGFGNAAISLGTVLGAFIITGFSDGNIPDAAMRILQLILGGSMLVDVVVIFNEKRLSTLIVPIEEDRLSKDVFGQTTVIVAPEEKFAPWKERCAKVEADYNLTQREAQVMRSLARGKSAQQIADEEVLSVYTVRAHTRSLYAKLDVHSKSEVAALIDNVKMD